MDRIVLNRAHETDVNAGQTFMLGCESAVAGVGVIDFDTLNDTLYGFYTTRAIEIMAIEHIVVEAHVCTTTAGIASLTDGATVFATVTAVDAAAAHAHTSGVLGTTTKVEAGKMLYMKITTASDDGTSEAGEGYFIVTYR